MNLNEFLDQKIAARYEGDALFQRIQSEIRGAGLVRFELWGEEYPLVPRSSFYDFLYAKALYQDRNADLAERLCGYRVFTDIMFNPGSGKRRKYNTQARSCAIFVSLTKRGLIDDAMCDIEYCSYLHDLLEEYRIPASLIKIEITESMMLEDTDVSKRLVATFKDMGVSLALDDFGTGFSSFDRLAYDAIDFVKLDKTFVDSFLAADTETVTRNLVQLIHDLGKRVVMEGVETREQMEACVRLGCDYIQGYYFSKPMAPRDVPTWEPKG